MVVSIEFRLPQLQTSASEKNKLLKQLLPLYVTSEVTVSTQWI
jgi:hypothetical protein